MKQTILVTGGAGYIGSHVVRQLGTLGYNVIVLDNLSTGFRDAVLWGLLVVGDTGDKTLVTKLFETYNIKTVMHFAAHTVVPESVTNPLKYYRNNTFNTQSLLECCNEAGVEHFIFSSTAAVYGTPVDTACDEESETKPINPYGNSKLMSEKILRDLSTASSLRHVILRYFNVAGADLECRIGQSTANATLLIKVICEAAVGLREGLTIYGTDYPTKDGTGVRDYIHVEDLARAHIKALDYLERGGASTTLNCGYGHGYSVREVLQTMQDITGHFIPFYTQPRRLGDPASVVAVAEKIKTVLGWTPKYDDLAVIVRSALNWEKNRSY